MHPKQNVHFKLLLPVESFLLAFYIIILFFIFKFFFPSVCSSVKSDKPAVLEISGEKPGTMNVLVTLRKGRACLEAHSPQVKPQLRRKAGKEQSCHTKGLFRHHVWVRRRCRLRGQPRDPGCNPKEFPSQSTQDVLSATLRSSQFFTAVLK